MVLKIMFGIISVAIIVYTIRVTLQDERDKRDGKV